MKTTPACGRCGLPFDSTRHAGVCPRCALAHLFGSASDLPALSGASASALALPSAGPATLPTGPTATPPEVPQPGTSWGDFDLVVELGRGGMGTVWLAHQRSLDRLVALKFIGTGLPADVATLLEARLQREARAAAALSHPAIVGVHEAGHRDGRAFLVMEFIEGGDLRSRLRQGPLAAPAAARLAATLADALAHAHAAGVLHRDVKPGNILLGSDGAPRLADFGLAAATEGARELTRTGELAGTPAYVAPELIAGQPATPASDLYALGAVLYESVAGRPPFTGENATAILAQITQREPVAPRLLAPGLPRDLDTIILKLLEKNPAARYASAGALRDELRAFLDGRPIAARPLSPVGRAARWARRNRALAATGALALSALVAVAAISTVSAVRLAHARSAEAAQRAAAETARSAAERARAQAETEAARATAAEGATRTQLRSALLAEARATRRTGEAGQRTAALASLREAAAIAPGIDLRDEALAALVRADLTEEQRWTLRTAGYEKTVFDLARDQLWIEAEEGGFHRVPFGQAPDLTRPVTLAAPAGVLAQGLPVLAPGGRWFAAHFNDDAVRVYDAGAASGAATAPVLTLPGRPYPLPRAFKNHGKDLAFSPDGALLTVAAPDGGLELYRLPHPTPVARWTPAPPGPGRDTEARAAAGGDAAAAPVEAAATSAAAMVTAVVFSPDGSAIAVVRLHERPGLVRVFALPPAGQTGAPAIPGGPEGTPAPPLELTPARAFAAPGLVGSLAWSPAGDELALGSDGQVHLVSAADGRPRLSLPGFEGNVLYLFWSLDGSRLLTWSEERRLIWWEAATGRPLVTLNEQQEFAPAFDPRTQRVAKLARVTGAAVWRIAESRIVEVFPSALPGGSVSFFGQTLAWSLTNNELAVAQLDGVSVREIPSGRVLARTEFGRNNEIHSIAWGPAGVWVADARAGLRHLPLEHTGRTLRSPRPHDTNDVPELRFGAAQPAPGHDGFIITSNRDNVLALGRVRQDDPAHDHLRVVEVEVPRDGGPARARERFSQPIPGLATTGFDGANRLWIGIDPSTAELAAGHNLALDAATGAELLRTQTLAGFGISTGDSGLVTTDIGQTGAALLHASDGRPSHPLELPEGLLPDAHAISEAGGYLAFAYSGTIHLLHAADGRVLARLPPPVDGNLIVALKFSRSHRLAVLYNNARVAVWDLPAMVDELRALGLEWNR